MIKITLVPVSNPDFGRRAMGFSDGRCRFKKLQIWSWLRGCFDPLTFEIGWSYLRNGRSEIRRMETLSLKIALL
jgi:hypothetical protein